MRHILPAAAIVLSFICNMPLSVRAQDTIELETTRIKGNTELPKYLYVVPWQDKERINKEQQKLVLHNLYGELFDPVLPSYIPVQHNLTPELELPVKTK